MRERVLVVEDDAVARALLAEVLEREGYEVEAVGSLAAARAAAPAAVAVTDLRLGDGDGLQFLRELKAHDTACQVIVVTAFGALETAVEAIRSGAFDYVSKPFAMDEICVAVRRAIESRRAAATPTVDDERDDSVLIGRSKAMTVVFTAVARLAALKTSVLIQGETGTGKELVARAIHEASTRARANYVTVNCASIPEGVLESELFGHVKGAFTGATADRAGLFEAAHKGTIFLDEIGDMPRSVQAKLLRVLESGEVRPVGSTAVLNVDARIVAATHHDLEEACEAGAFRRDLFFRLNAVTIELPPLRERGDDVLLLAKHFVRQHARATERPVPSVSEPALAALGRYAWPGNVRELSHVMERAMALSQSATLDLVDFPPRIAAAGTRRLPDAVGQRLEDVERAHILAVIKSVDGNRTHAASILGIDRKTLYRKLTRYGIEQDEE